MELILVILVLFGTMDLSQGQSMFPIPGGPAAEQPWISPDWLSIASTACSAYGGNIGTMDQVHENSILQLSCTAIQPCVLAIKPSTFTYANSQFTDDVVNRPAITEINGYVFGVEDGCIEMFGNSLNSYTFQYSSDCTGALLCSIYDFAVYSGFPAASLPNTTPVWTDIVSTACIYAAHNPARFNSQTDAIPISVMGSSGNNNTYVLAIDVETWMWVQPDGNEVEMVTYPSKSQIFGFPEDATIGCITVDANQWPPSYAYSTSCDMNLLCSYNPYPGQTTTTTTETTTTTTETGTGTTTTSNQNGLYFVDGYTAAPPESSPPYSYLWQYCGNYQIATLYSQSDEQYITNSLCPASNPCVLAINPETYEWTLPSGEQTVTYPEKFQIIGYTPSTSGCITVSVLYEWSIPVYSYSQNCTGFLLCSNIVSGSTTAEFTWWTTSGQDYVNSAGAASIFGFWILSFLAALLWLIQQL